MRVPLWTGAIYGCAQAKTSGNISYTKDVNRFLSGKIDVSPKLIESDVSGKPEETILQPNLSEKQKNISMKRFLHPPPGCNLNDASQVYE